MRMRAYKGAIATTKQCADIANERFALPKARALALEDGCIQLGGPDGFGVELT